MIKGSIESTLQDAWKLTTGKVINQSDYFSGKEKELRVTNLFKEQILNLNPKFQIIGPNNQRQFESWFIDLVVDDFGLKTAIEVKYKLFSDRAVPDNRKAVFYDLLKIENYVRSGEYSFGAFFMLTNNPSYLNIAQGDSKDFTIHNNREYKSMTVLTCKRNRGNLPLNLFLKNDYHFCWEQISHNWYSIEFCISN